MLSTIFLSSLGMTVIIIVNHPSSHSENAPVRGSGSECWYILVSIFLKSVSSQTAATNGHSSSYGIELIAKRLSAFSSSLSRLLLMLTSSPIVPLRFFSAA